MVFDGKLNATGTAFSYLTYLPVSSNGARQIDGAHENGGRSATGALWATLGAWVVGFLTGLAADPVRPIKRIVAPDLF